MWSPPNDSAHPSLRRPNGTCSTSSSGCCGLSGTSPSSDVVFGFGRTAKVSTPRCFPNLPEKKHPSHINPLTIPSIYPEISRHISNHQPPTNHGGTHGLAVQALGRHEVPQGSPRQLPHRAAGVRLEVTCTQQGDAVEEIVHLGIVVNWCFFTDG